MGPVACGSVTPIRIASGGHKHHTTSRGSDVDPRLMRGRDRTQVDLYSLYSELIVPCSPPSPSIDLASSRSHYRVSGSIPIDGTYDLPSLSIHGAGSR